MRNTLNDLFISSFCRWDSVRDNRLSFVTVVCTRDATSIEYKIVLLAKAYLAAKSTWDVTACLLINA